MPVLNVNMSAVIRHTARLERIRKSALPAAARNTLNRAALDVKTNTMPKESDIFTRRNKTFFKANSKVEFAKGNDINNMKATVGFVENSGTQQQAVQDQEQQENAGSIGGRAFIPLKQARTGNSYSKNVRAQNRISVIRNKIVDSDDSAGGSKGERFTRAAIHAGKGGVVIGNKIQQGKRIVFRINSIHRLTDGVTTKAGKSYSKGNMVMNVTPIYSLRAGRRVHPKATHFMKKATLKTVGKMEAMYIEEAEKQILKYK